MLGLCCCAQAFSTCGEWGLFFVVGPRLLTEVASLVAEHRHTGFSSCGSRAPELRLSSCDAQALLLRGLWDLPRPGLKPMSPALAGGFSTTAPPEKPSVLFLKMQVGLVLCLLKSPN